MVSQRPTDPPSGSPGTIGGGVKKLRYTLEVMRRTGLRQSSKALLSNNACKACGLGMGGQRGGMTNEAGEFPAVCNKSVQAQSTDIQPPIPAAVFEHPVSTLRQLQGRELEQLGRLDQPLYKASGAARFAPVSWEWALAHAGQHFAATDPARSFFYASGRSSNEAGFVFALLARLYGTNNVNNCSYYCHQATSVALEHTIGTGTATVELEDLGRCDLVFVIGANPASNHPRFIHQLQGVRARGGEVVVINPAREPGLVRFAIPKSPRSILTGGDWIASEYLQPRIGGDIALLLGLAKAVLASGSADTAFIAAHTSQFEDYRSQLEALSWADIERSSGLPQQRIEALAATYSRSRNAIFAWGMGMTHHAHGVANIESISNLALLRGMIGRPGAGLLPLRGHSNVQGIGTVGVKPVLASDVLTQIEQQLGVQLPDSTGMDTLACMEAAAAGEVDAALIMGGNLYAATPDSQWAARALAKIGLRVFLTTTLNSGHVNGCDDGESLILPVTARDEEWQPTTQESMFNYVRLSDGGITRLAKARPEVAVLTELASHLVQRETFDFAPFANHRTIRQAIAETVPGMEELADIDVAKREFHIRRRLKHVPEFDLPSGRARFVVAAIPPSADSAEFPHTLMTVRSEGQFNSIIYEESDSYRGTASRWVLMASPATIAALDLGERCNLVSAHGRMDGLWVHPYPLAGNDLMAYYPEANVLVGRTIDVRSRTPAFKSVPVRVERLE